MVTVSWKMEAGRLLLAVFSAGLIGYLIHMPWLSMLLVALAFCGWYCYQLSRIQHWLERDEQAAPPESRGLWGEVFNGIYRFHRRHIREQQRLQHRLAYLREALASLSDGVIMLDNTGNIEWSNKSAEGLLGLSFPADQGQPLINLVRNPSFVKYFETGNYERKLELAPYQHDERFLQFEISFFGKGSRMVFVRDITEAHRLQQMRKDFIANVSHELRTPLTVITGYLETMRDSDMLADERLQRPIKQMIGQSHRMESLVRDLIMLSRLEAVPEVFEQSRIDV